MKNLQASADISSIDSEQFFVIILLNGCEDSSLRLQLLELTPLSQFKP